MSRATEFINEIKTPDTKEIESIWERYDWDDILEVGAKTASARAHAAHSSDEDLKKKWQENEKVLKDAKSKLSVNHW